MNPHTAALKKNDPCGASVDDGRRRFADHIAAQATRALLYEVSVTPKPGLVDRNNNGAHADMDIFTFIDSATALTPYFADITRRGMAFSGGIGQLLPSLRQPGMVAEEAMYRATGGVNTHKGLIFSLGVFCAALGHMRTAGAPVTEESLLAACAAMTAETPRELAAAATGECQTHGGAAHAKFGVTGVRGEAAAGYPGVRLHGLPALRRLLGRGMSLNDAGAITLLHLLAHVQDTNVIARSDLETLEAIQRELREVLAREDDPEALLRYACRLDERFIARNISPGGCADLLALSLFLHFIL